MADPNAPPPYPQTGYVPQQPGYPTPQPTYPPQQAYPPQPAYQYPPAPHEKPHHPATGYQPPPGPPPAQTGASTNVVVVQQQPQIVTTTVYTRRYGQNDHGLVYAILASCAVFWCLGWPGLFCTVPAIFLSLSAQQEEHAGNLELMKQHHNYSLILSTVGLVVGFGFLIIWIIVGSATD